MGIPLILSSVPAVTPYIQYVASSGQTLFPFPFPITQDSDLVVVVNGITQATDAGYTLSGQGNPTGGNLTFTVGQTAGAIVTLFRNIPIERITQIAQNSGFSSTAFNAEYNNIYLILQQLQESIALSLQIPNTNSPSPTTTLTPGAYANKFLFFDANGNPTPASAIATTALTAALLAGLLQPQLPGEPTVVNGVWPVGVVDRYQTNAVPGTTIMTTGAQLALNFAPKVTFLPGETYLIDSSGALRNQDGGTICLGVKSNQWVEMTGAQINLAAPSTVNGSIFGNANPIVNTKLTGGVIDGNMANISGEMGGIVLWSGIDCDILGVKVQNILGRGLSHRGQTSLSPPYGRNSIQDCRVIKGGFLGIQCAHQTLGLRILRNVIDQTVDNSIDVEGDLALGIFSTITAITKAAQAQVTVSTGGALNPALVGNEVTFGSVGGMTGLNGQTARILTNGGVTGAWTFTINIDTTGMGAFTAGGTATMSGDGNHCIISQNTCTNGSADCAIFVESVPNVTITDNVIDGFYANQATGIVCNRTHTPGNETVITGNRVKNLPNNGVGIKFNNSGKSLVEDNTFKNMKYSMWFFNNANFISLGLNTHEQIYASLFLIDRATNSLIWSRFTQQNYNGARDATLGTPFTSVPLNNVVNNSDRAFFVNMVATWFLQAGAAALATGGFTDLQIEYQDGTSGVLQGTFAAGAFSLFSAGETQINPTVAAGAWAVGKYIWIAGTVPRLYLINSLVSAGIYTIREPMLLVGTAPITGTSTTLTANFRGTTGAYNCTFYDGGGNSVVKAVTLTNGATTATWSGALPFTAQANFYTVAIPGNYTTNFTGAHACTQYYANYQTD